MKKIILVIASIVVIVIVVLVKVNRESKILVKENILRVGYKVQSINDGPIMIANDSKFFEKVGLTVEMVPMKSGKEIRQAIAMSHIDLALTTPANVFMVASTGVPVKIIAFSTFAKYLVYVRSKDEINSFDDLKGKKVFGGGIGNSELIFVNALNQEGINGSEITYVKTDNEYRELALVQHKIIDAIATSYHKRGFLEDAGAVPLKEWIEKGYGNTYWPVAVLAVRELILNEKMDLVRNFLTAFIGAHNYIVHNKNEAAQLISNHINIGTNGVTKFSNTEIQNIWEEGVKYVVWKNPQLLLDMSEIIIKSGLLETEFSLKAVLDFRFEKELKKAQGDIYGSENY